MHARRKILKYSGWTILALLLLAIIFRLALGPVSIAAIDHWFEQQGLSSEVTDISFDLGNGNVILSGLRASAADKPVLQLKLARIDWSWSALLDSQLRINSIALDGLEVDIEQGPGGQLMIAGSKAREPAAQAAPAPEPGEPLQWTLALGNVDVNEFKLCFRPASQDEFCNQWQAFRWDGEIGLDLARLGGASVPLRVAGDLQFSKIGIGDRQLEREQFGLNDLSITGIAVTSPDAGGNELGIDAITLDGLHFDVEQGPKDRLVIAGIDLQALTQQPDPAPPVPAGAGAPPAWKLALGDFALNEFKLCYRAPPLDEYCNQWEKLNWKGKASLDLARSGEAALPLQVKGDLQLTRLSLEDTKLERDLLAFDDFSISGVAVDNLDNISVGLVKFDALALLERAGESNQPQISFIRELDIAGLKLEQQSHLDIAEIQLLDHQVIMVKRAEGGLELQDWLESIARDESTAPVEASAAAAEASAAPARPFSFAIARISYKTSKSIQYSDLSQASPFEANLNNIEIEIDNLDSRKPEQYSHLRYAAKYANHGGIKLEGDITPLAEKRSFDLVGRIEGFDLRSLSPLTAAAVGHNIKSGQLDADLKLKAKDNILDSEIDLVLLHFNFSALSAADKEKVDANFGFPLNSTLSLMKDRDDRIELNVPLTGDLLNPDISPRDAIRQAVSTAITAAILNYYTPFGLVSLADGVFSLATALKFEPVIFAPGSDDIGNADLGGLDKLVTLMQEKPGVHLTLCPYTNSADRIQLFAKTAAVEPQAFVPDAKQQEQLASLGEARAAAVKNYLVDRKIEASRLVLCSSEHVEDVVQAASGKDGDGVESVTRAGIAGVEISI